MLSEKIKQSIDMLHRAEPLALELNPTDGYYLAFSGGKDSQCIMELARLAGVKYKAYYSVTGIDSPQNVHFINQFYPEVQFIHHKKNFFRLVEQKGLPMMQSRFCCERLKENLGAGNVLIDGVRAEESTKRSTYTNVMIRSRRKENATKGRHRTIEEIENNAHRCIKGKDRIDIHPLLNWTAADVWQFITQQQLPYNPCYENVGRVGCMFCPYATRQQIHLYIAKFPKYTDRLLRAIEVFLQKKPLLPSAELYLDWWLSRMTLIKYKTKYDIWTF